MLIRARVLFVGALLAAPTVSCETQQSTDAKKAEAPADAKKAAASPSSAGSPSTDPSPTLTKDPIAKTPAAKDPAPSTSTAAPPPTGVVEPPAAATLPKVARITRTVTVGKWPEEVAVLGNEAFVAVSGSRVVRRVDLKTGDVKEDIRAGTFPVNIVTGAKEVWTVDYNRSRALFEIDASGKATKRGVLPDHVEQLAFGEGMVFALLAKKGSNVDSTVAVFDPATGTQKRSDATGNDPAGIAVGHGKVWATAGGGLMVLDPTSLAIEARIPLEGKLPDVFTNGSAVYVASLHDGTYVRIDPATRDVTDTVEVGEEYVMAVQDDRVVTLGHSGKLTIWDAKDGNAQAKLDVGQPIQGRWMTWHGAGLVVTAHGTDDENEGSLHVLSLE
jgi:YVTN family beta-propeller protein